jgi:4-aminobutyrate aminotransferase/4-aminobutyrate aminotransferase/(S)-3-amino-2-methylpropionate transaminase
MNDPLGAAIAAEVIAIIQTDDLIRRGAEIGRRLAAGLERIAAKTGAIAALRHRGPMLAVDLKDNEQATATTRVHRNLVERGYVLAKRPGLNVLRIDPSLTIERKDIDGFLDALGDILTGGA